MHLATCRGSPATGSPASMTRTAVPAERLEASGSHRNVLSSLHLPARSVLCGFMRSVMRMLAPHPAPPDTELKVTRPRWLSRAGSHGTRARDRSRSAPERIKSPHRQIKLPATEFPALAKMVHCRQGIFKQEGESIE